MTCNYQYIESIKQLEDFCQRWQSHKFLAIDTEFIRTRTFYPIVGLIQVYDGEDCVLIDPLTISDFACFNAILSNENIVKVLHSCSEDLEVFESGLGTLPSNIFDTQVAAAFLGYGFSVGYSNLLKAVFNLDIPKDESRSDWLKRPLSESQLEYAALDVIHLYALYQNFSEQLENTQLKQWVNHCNQELLGNFRTNQQPENYYKRMKNAWRLNKQAQLSLYHLCLWRDSEAKNKNRPRSHIVKDEHLWAIADSQPSTLEDLNDIQGISTKLVERYGNSILDILQSTKDQPAPEKFSISPRPLPRGSSPLMKQLKALVRERAEELNISPEMLIRKKSYEAFIRSGMEDGNFSLPPELLHWRQELIGNDFIDLASTWYSND